MKYRLFGVVLLLLTGVYAEAQQQQRRPRPSSTQSGGWTRSRTTPSRSTANAVPTVSRAPVNVPSGRTSATASNPGGGWNTRPQGNPLEPYERICRQIGSFTGYRYSPWDLYYSDIFFSRLRMDFGYLSAGDSFWAYAQGLPGLTPQAADMALRTSTRAADRILAATAGLDDLLDAYEAKSISQNEFEDEVKQLLDEIRDQTKSVRNDFYVDYLDQRKGLDVKSVDRVESIAGLRELVADLRDKALDLKRDFDNYFKEDRTRVVSVDDLAQPSFKSRSKEIDKLTAAIKKSVTKL